MSNDQQETHYQIIHLIESIIRNGNNSKTSTEGYSYEFALSALKSSMFINAGSFVALPAYKNIISDIDIFFPSIIFALGIVFSALSMFFSYMNLQYYSDLHFARENWRASKVLLEYEKSIGAPTHQRELEIESFSKSSMEHERKVRRYFNLAIIFGFSSYLLFIIGFFISARSYFFSIICASS